MQHLRVLKQDMLLFFNILVFMRRCNLVLSYVEHEKMVCNLEPVYFKIYSCLLIVYVSC